MQACLEEMKTVYGDTAKWGGRGRKWKCFSLDGDSSVIAIEHMTLMINNMVIPWFEKKNTEEFSF